MSNLDHIEINNALNNYYGNKMKLYVEGSEFREEYRQKMKEQKKLVEELSIKAEAFDECEAKVKAFDEIKVYMQSAEDKLCDEEYFNEDVYEEYYGIIESVIEHHSENESGESDV